MNRLCALRDFLWYVIRKFQQDRCLQSASSLTTTTLFALVPLVTISLHLLSFFPDFPRMTQAIHQFLLANMLPDAASRVIGIYMNEFSNHARQLTYAGLVLLTGTVFSLAITVDHTFNAIWGMKPQRTWWARFLIYASLILLGPLLLGLGLWATGLIVSASMGWAGENHHMTELVLRLVSVLVLAFGLTLAYYRIPGRPVALRHATLGGLLAALSFEGMKTLFSVFIWHFSSYTLVYGTFAAFPFFLLWIQMSWTMVLFCAVLTACMPLWKHEGWRVVDNTEDQVADEPSSFS